MVPPEELRWSPGFSWLPWLLIQVTTMILTLFDEVGETAAARDRCPRAQYTEPELGVAELIAALLSHEGS